MKAVQAEGSRGAGRTQMGMERQGSWMEAVSRLQCGGLSNQATTSPCEPRRSRASQHSPVLLLILIPHLPVLWRQGLYVGAGAIERSSGGRVKNQQHMLEISVFQYLCPEQELPKQIRAGVPCALCCP